MKRRALAAIALALAVSASVTATAAADGTPQGGGANNVVVARTGTDGDFTAKDRTKVTQTGGVSVTPSNVAVALADSCTGCRASAVAVQALIFEGSPSVYAPENAAAAVNSNCTSCGTYAYAWQYLVQVDRPFHLSGEARQRIHDLGDQIDQITSSIVPASVDDDALLDFQLNGLTAQLRSVIDGEVAAADVQPTAHPIERVDEEGR